MADNIAITAGSGTSVSTEEITTLNGGAVSAQHIQRVAVAARTADGTAVDLPASTADGVLVNLGANNDVTVTGSVAVTGPLTDTQLRATAVPVSGTFYQATQPVSIATAVPVTDNSGSLTVDGTVAVTNGGTFVVQENGAALTSLQLLDDTVATIASTIPSKGIALLGADTTTARMIRVDAAGELQVDVATLPSNASVNVAQINGVTTTMGNGVSGTGVQRVTIASDSTGVVGLNAGTNTIGAVNVKPATSGGLTTYHLASAASTNATSVKASPGQLFGWYIYNSNAATRKVAFHNTSGTPTAGSSVFFSVVIPATSGANVEFTNGIAFSSGIAITTVTGLADSDSTGVASNDLIINLFYA